MRVHELIDDETKKQLKVKEPAPVSRPVKKNREKLSRRDIEELMGTHRDRYHRVSVKVKRK